MAVELFQCKYLGEVQSLSLKISKYFSNPAMVLCGIYELLTNAIEHGNLGIGYDLKTQLLQENRWEQEIEKRKLNDECALREVRLTLFYDEAGCALTIADQGKGFDWRHYMRKPLDLRAHHGRGLMIARSCNFDELRFDGAGNIITCIERKKS